MIPNGKGYKQGLVEGFKIGAQAEREKIIEDMKNINMLGLMGVDNDNREMLHKVRDVFVTWLEQGK